jgi:hypothetical protein
MRIAFPHVGDNIKMPVITAQGPTLSFVTYDTYDMTLDNTGNAVVILTPNMVNYKNLAVNASFLQNIGFFTPPTHVHGDITNTASNNWTYATDSWLTGNFQGNVAPSAGKYVRARINSVSVEYQYIGAPLYASGLTTVQIYQPLSTTGSANINVPLSKSYLCETYKTMPSSHNWIMSLPCVDRLSAGLSVPHADTGFQSGLLSNTSAGGGWPSVCIRVIGGLVGQQPGPIVRIIVRRLIDVQVNPTSQLLAALECPHPVEITGKVYSAMESFVADKESQIHDAGINGDPQTGVWDSTLGSAALATVIAGVAKLHQNAPHYAAAYRALRGRFGDMRHIEQQRFGEGYHVV